MKIRKNWIRVAVCAALFVIASIGAVAQTVTASVRGSVEDPSGAVVANAEITARNVNTGVKTVTRTDKSGSYNIQTLSIGSYVLTVAKPGFSKSSIGPFTLDIDQIAKFNVKLQIGEVSTTVEVGAGSGALLQTEDASLGTTITASTLESMPLPGQNFSAATVFVPGAVLPTYSSLGTTQGTERDTSFASSTQPSFNGNRMQTNNYIFDGTDINEPLQNTIAYNPAPEAIGQMRIITGNADAEYGNVNGGEIIAVTKTGTNKFHGSVYEFYENQNWQANSWANHYNKTNKSNFHQSQFGATFGGPIYKNKLFFFADFEGFRNTTAGASVPVAVPSLRMRKGDFSEFLGAPTLDYGQSIPSSQYIQFYNTAAGNCSAVVLPACPTITAVPYANDQLPINNPTAAYIFAHPEFYPLPNRPSTNANSPDTGNYLGYSKSAFVNNQGDIRIDYTMSQKDNMWARYTHGGSYDDPIVSYLSFEFPGGDDYPFWNGVLNEVHTFTPNLQNEFRAGYSRVANLSGLPFDSTGLFPAGSDTKVGIPYASPYPGFTETNISSAEKNYGTLGVVQNTIDNIFDYGDTFTWLHGKHIIKGGAQVLRYQENYYYPGNTGAMGEFAYNGQYSKSSTTAGYGFADVVLDKSELAAVNGVTGRVGQRQYRMAFFGEDEWKVTPRLTLNIGLRYGYDQPMYEVNNKEANLDLTKAAGCSIANPICIEYAGKNGNSRALYNSFYKEFMPRLSFAYQMNPQMVIRGGYAITDDFEGMGAAQRLTENPPFIPAYSNTPTAPSANSPGTPISVTQGFNGGSISSATSKFNAWDKNIKPELIQQYNFTLETAMGPRFTFQLGYVGNVAQHLVIPEQINQWSCPTCSATAPWASLVGTGGVVYLTTAEGYSNYNAMQIQLRQRTWHGLEYTFNYTWSKNMTNNPGYFGIGGVDGPSTYPQDVNNPHSNYGVSGFDTRNGANFVGTYAIPFGHGRDYGNHVNRFVDWAIGGWKVSADAVMYSGFPITIGSSTGYSVNGGGVRANQYHTLRIVNRSLTHWFGTGADIPTATNSGCLATTPPATGTPTNTVPGGPVGPECAYGTELNNGFGTAHVGTERAPGYRVVDVSAFKQFRTYKEQYIQFRADGFNVGNIASYSAPGSTITSPSTFGLITSTLSPARQIQLSLKYEF